MNISWMAVLTATLTIATPLVFGALGAILNERAGVLNLGIEGTMYAGAFVGFWAADRWGSAWAGLAAVHRKLPDAIPRTVTRLLPEFVGALEPLHARSRAADGAAFARFLKQDRTLVAETLMGIADARVERSTNAALKAFYARFRSTAEHEAEDLIPGVADVLARHL